MEVRNLAEFGQCLTNEERANYRLVIAYACRYLIERLDDLDMVEKSTLSKALELLKKIHPYHDSVPDDGVIWHGKASFITSKQWIELNQESIKCRGNAKRYDKHLRADGGSAAMQVANHPELVQLIKNLISNVRPAGKADYLYYDQEGMGIAPHVDNVEFPINSLLMLEHSYIKDPSAFVIYTSSLVKRRIFLAPGEMIIFYAHATIHHREFLRTENELVRLASLGFAT
jgi:hypothetical protein